MYIILIFHVPSIEILKLSHSPKIYHQLPHNHLHASVSLHAFFDATSTGCTSSLPCGNGPVPTILPGIWVRRDGEMVPKVPCESCLPSKIWMIEWLKQSLNEVCTPNNTLSHIQWNNSSIFQHGFRRKMPVSFQHQTCGSLWLMFHLHILADNWTIKPNWFDLFVKLS